MSATILPFARPPADAVMALHAEVPATAMTAGLLGVERFGHAVQVDEGLILTAGYSVLEAEKIWLTNRKGQSSEAVVLAQDFNSGIALLKPMQSLGKGCLETAELGSVQPGTQVKVLTSNNEPLDASVFALEEFAGRWEYLLDEAIYTVPLCEHWSGTPLINAEGKLIGIGSLALGLSDGEGDLMPGNLFIPTELVTPHLEHLALHGELPGQQRPWLGLFTEEQEAGLQVTGVYQHAPASDAGVKPGDIILAVDSRPISSMPDFFRSVWHYGPAGSNIPLTVMDPDNDSEREIVLRTIDRNAFFNQYAGTTLN